MRIRLAFGSGISRDIASNSFAEVLGATLTFSSATFTTASDIGASGPDSGSVPVPAAGGRTLGGASVAGDAATDAADDAGAVASGEDAAPDPLQAAIATATTPAITTRAMCSLPARANSGGSVTRSARLLW